MTLERFNQLEPSEAVAVLRPCIDVSRWIDEIAQARPFTSIEALLDCAGKAANPFADAEIDSALSHHPRIGERAAGSNAEAALSRSEQAALGPTDAQVAAELVAGNRAYEEKFGRVFLIRAAGRSSREILAALNERLQNTPETENPIVAQQLREIALLRLKGGVTA
ncbi:2-oxo-4-hydroxy-4-carboxy-5-ureidoimidazoline decarboxylase [Paenarthrobacter sp. PH39-S1]|uniref:2-oxo-4-hydroxy-4-carboxy-5-ureidoimidazoline decarboxylase n=1 Tax=Paenarthrobacter sp. PH39-S1 TaxID=3046204 RepID=UPI0024BA66E4|nr:2-oxo-4-hydroxy-4-carboxy-5-ureidoimidazoline decarboxylase [Paenarthrobacter sp. PH39-S1]MDJ0356216.1 2-oxo-4-hydroxy-4-carboxy-5-ureidoimidazoline decarboxylase [Paenarthrobacter sp. PH39-S1]